MTNENLLDQTTCNLPFEVVTIYDNGSQLQHNTNKSWPSSVNVKIRIRNKQDTEAGKHGIISVPKVTTKNVPKRIQLVNSDQTIMSFNLALEPNSDEAQKKNNRRLLQMFKPGGCLSIRREEDCYSYMPSTSNDLKRKSASSIDQYESTITDTFALKKYIFSSSYTNALKPPKTFLGKCKPGGCLDPPFSEDNYTYKPTNENAETPHPALSTNSPDMDIIDVKQKKSSPYKKNNILHKSNPETKILENAETLVTYPSILSSSKSLTKSGQTKKSNLRVQNEQVELSRNLDNDIPEAYFMVPRKEKPKYLKSYDKYYAENNGAENKLKVKEAYINKDYTLQSQTPSEMLSDALTITSQSFNEPLQELTKEKPLIREINSKQFILETESLLNKKISIDKIENNSTSFSGKDFKIDRNLFLEDKILFNHNNDLVQKVLYKDVSSLNSSDKVNLIQEINDDISYKKKSDLSIIKNNSNYENQQRSISCSLNLSKDRLTKTSYGSIIKSSISLDNFGIIEEQNLLRKKNSDINYEFNKAEITKIKQLGDVKSEEYIVINPVKVNENASLEYEYVKNIICEVINDVVKRGDINSKTNKQLISVQKGDDDNGKNIENIENKQLKNISETTKVLVQDIDFKDDDNTEELIDDRPEHNIKQIMDVQPFSVSELLPKVTLLHSSDSNLSLKKSRETNDVNIVFDSISIEKSKSSHSTNDKKYGDNHNEKLRYSILKNTLSHSLNTEYKSEQKIEMNTINAGFNLPLESQTSPEISSKHDKLSDTDIIFIPEVTQINSLSRSKIDINNPNETKSQKSLSVTSQTKTLKDSHNESQAYLKTVPHTYEELVDFDTLQYPKSTNYNTSKEEATKFNLSRNDLNPLFPNHKSDVHVNNNKINISPDDNFPKPINDSAINLITSLQTLPYTNVHRGSEIGVHELETKETISQNLSGNYSPVEFKFNQNNLSITRIHNISEDFTKSELIITTSKTKSSLNFDNIQELKIIDPKTDNNKSYAHSERNINSISAVAINFGFHSSTNEQNGFSLGTFDPSIKLVNYPHDKIVTIETILKKDDSEIKVPIDSETNLAMKIKSSRNRGGSRTLGPDVLNTNDRRRDNISVSSLEAIMNKDNLLQETLNAVYETLKPIEKIIINLREEADSLYREQLFFKEILLTKEIKPNRIISKVSTCNCLQKEIGLTSTTTSKQKKYN